MATVVITIDTEENTVTASIDGKEVADVTSVSAYKYEDYYNKNKPKVSWNISANNSTGDDDFSSYVNYCSATASVGRDGAVNIKLSGTKVMEEVKAELSKDVYEKARADISSYFDKKRGK